MGYCFTEIEQETELGSIEDKDIEALKNKHQEIVELFEGEFLKKDSDGKVWILGDKSFSLDSREFSTQDDGKPNKYRARVRFFEGSEMEIFPHGTGEFGWGQQGFSRSFYSDLAVLINEEVSFYAGELDCGDNGYYSGSYELYQQKDDVVFKGSFSYYEREEDEDW